MAVHAKSAKCASAGENPTGLSPDLNMVMVIVMEMGILIHTCHLDTIRPDCGTNGYRYGITNVIAAARQRSNPSGLTAMGAFRPSSNSSIENVRFFLCVPSMWTAKILKKSQTF